MKVLTIIHYDTMQGSVEDIVQIPEGKTEDEVFLTWIRIKRNAPTLTMEEVTKNDGYLYHWEACEVNTFDQPDSKKSGKEITYEEKFKEFIKMTETIKQQKIDVVIIAEPWVIGDNYQEIVESLNRLADAGLKLSIAKSKRRP